MSDESRSDDSYLSTTANTSQDAILPPTDVPSYSQPQIAQLFGSPIEDPYVLPYSSDRVLWTAADRLETVPSMKGSPEKMAAFANRFLNIKFPDFAIEYAQHQVDVEYHSTDLRTLCYLIDGHSHWYRTQTTTSQQVTNSISVRADRLAIVFIDTYATYTKRMAATARRVARLPTALHSNQIRESISNFFE